LCPDAHFDPTWFQRYMGSLGSDTSRMLQVWDRLESITQADFKFAAHINLTEKRKCQQYVDGRWHHACLLPKNTAIRLAELQSALSSSTCHHQLRGILRRKRSVNKLRALPVVGSLLIPIAEVFDFVGKEKFIYSITFR
jgi:hypothetical protein